MNNISFMLMADTYKNTNPDAMPEGLTKLTSYVFGKIEIEQKGAKM